MGWESGLKPTIFGRQANVRNEINELTNACNPKVIFIDNISNFDCTGNEAESCAPIQEVATQHRKKTAVYPEIFNYREKMSDDYKASYTDNYVDAILIYKLLRLAREDIWASGASCEDSIRKCAEKLVLDNVWLRGRIQMILGQKITLSFNNDKSGLMAQVHSRYRGLLKLSGLSDDKLNLVAGVGFEPTTFRL